MTVIDGRRGVAVAIVLLTLAVAAGGVAADEPAEFEVVDVQPDADLTVEEGETVPVGAFVENAGEGAGVDVVELVVDGDVVASEEVALDPGEREVVSVDLEPPSEGSYEWRFETADDVSESYVLTVEEADDVRFEIVDVTPEGDHSLETGDPVDVEVTVENVGSEAGADDVEVVLGPSGDREPVELDAGDRTTVTVTLPTPPDGEYDWGVLTDDDVAGPWTLTVGDGEPDEPAEFEIVDVTPDGDRTVADGEPLEVEATVANPGDEATTDEVVLAVDGAVGDVEPLELGAGERDVVRLSADAVDGEWLVATSRDVVGPWQLTVEDADEDADADDEDADADDADADADDADDANEDADGDTDDADSDDADDEDADADSDGADDADADDADEDAIDADELPGFGALVALLAVLFVGSATARWARLSE